MVLRLVLVSWLWLGGMLAAAEPLTVLLPAERDARCGGVVLAEADGLFTQAGLVVRLRHLAPDQEAVAAVQADPRSFALVSDEVLRQRAGRSVALLGILTSEAPRVLVVRSDGPASVADLLVLPSNRLPTWPEPADLGLQIAVRRAGADPDRVLSAGRPLLSDFTSGELAAYPATIRERIHLNRLGVSIRLLPGERGAFGLGVIANGELARQEPDTVTAVFAAMREGWERARREPRRLVDALLSDSAGTTRLEVVQEVDAILATLSDQPQVDPLALQVLVAAGANHGVPITMPALNRAPEVEPSVTMTDPAPSAFRHDWRWWIGEAALVLIIAVWLARRRARKSMESLAADQKPRLTQEQLLPDLPELDGWDFAVHYRPHAGVSGDFYLATQLSDGRWLIAVGDVSGHGVQAALVVSGILKAGELLAHRHDSLAGWLADLQKTIAPDLRQGLFVTMVVVALDPVRADVECARSGHPPAFCTGPGGWREVGAIGLAIGIGDTQTFRAGLRTQRLVMQPGDDLLLFTDGLTEVMDRSGQEFGIAGLQASAERHAGESAQELVDHLVQDAAGHGSGVTDDDLTVLVIRRRPGGAP